jgi:3',5'-cyclic AMP phosphodiesterase CpdA
MGDLVTDLVTNVRFSNVTGKPAQNVAGLTAATAPNATTDGLTTNQAQLSYSFDINSAAGLLHFVVINTDATGADTTAPVGWLANDLATAKTHGALKYFVFGHKPAFTYNYTAANGGTLAAAGLDANPANRNALWSLITQYGATYFCGHEHIVHAEQFADPTGANSGTPWQILVGSGGSPFDDKLVNACPSCTEPVFTNPTDRSYAWAFVHVRQSGAVTLTAYAFNDSFGPTQTVMTINGLQ